jgi:hypothetical protein
MRHNFPKLYLLTDKKRVRIWEIWITTDNKTAKIYTKYGIKNGTFIESLPQIIDKSVGNITPYLRAQKLANTKWKNRIQKGYQEREPIIEEKTVIPMRAYPLTDKRVVFPAYVQPKLDGHRAILHKIGNKYEFLSNTRRQYKHLEHLTEDLNKIKILNDKNIYLDGELYIEDERVNILRGVLSSSELTKEKSEMAKKIVFYVFDMFDMKNMDLNYSERYNILTNIFKTNYKNIILTPTIIAKNLNDLDKYFTKYVAKGYEGIIVRNMRGLYKLRGKSTDILKSKDIKSDKFIIVGYREAKGNNSGTVVWEIRCNNDPRKSFWAKPMGSREDRRKMFKNAENYIGRDIMVKYFEKDNNGCITKNPVAYF